MKLGALLKWGFLIRESILEWVAEEVFAVRCFSMVYENLIEMQTKIRKPTDIW
jgi:hypothetical protein